MFAFLATLPAQALVYEVGDGLPYLSIGDVPWESLAPGDSVKIHYRPTDYHEKWVLCRQGTASQPIVICGIPSEARSPRKVLRRAKLGRGG